MRSGKDSALVSEVSVCVSSDLLCLEVAIGECEPPFPDDPSFLPCWSLAYLELYPTSVSPGRNPCTTSSGAGVTLLIFQTVLEQSSR